MSAINLQLPGLRPVAFGSLDHPDHLFQVVEGGSVSEGLARAADLALGLERLCARLDGNINNHDEAITCVEMRALGHLAGSAAALMQSVRYSLRNAEEASQ